jgi:rRNA maturation endonuclease Nob1
MDEGYQPVGNGTRKALGMKRLPSEEKKRKRKDPKVHVIGEKKMSKNYKICEHCGHQILKQRIQIHTQFDCRAAEDSRNSK